MPMMQSNIALYTFIACAALSLLFAAVTVFLFIRMKAGRELKPPEDFKLPTPERESLPAAFPGRDARR